MLILFTSTSTGHHGSRQLGSRRANGGVEAIRYTVSEQAWTKDLGQIIGSDSKRGTYKKSKGFIPDSILLTLYEYQILPFRTVASRVRTNLDPRGHAVDPLSRPHDLRGQAKGEPRMTGKIRESYTSWHNALKLVIKNLQLRTDSDTVTFTCIYHISPNF